MESTPVQVEFTLYVYIYWFVQTSRELKVCGAIGPCVSLNSKGACVSENVSASRLSHTSFNLELVFAAAHLNILSVFCAGDGCWWHQPVESVQPQPLHYFGPVFWSGESGKNKLILEPQLLSSDVFTVVGQLCYYTIYPIKEFTNKNRIYYKIQNIMELTIIDFLLLKFCFTEKTTHASLHKHSRPLSKHFKHVEGGGKETRYSPENTEPSSFWSSLRSVIRCIADIVNIMLSGNMQIHFKTTCSQKPVWKTRKTLQCTYSLIVKLVWKVNQII